MINIDKDYLITVDLKNTKVKSDKTIFFYNTDLNICNIFIKLICTDEDKAIPDDLIVEFAVLKPETDEFKPLDATLISKEDLLYQVDLTTDYFDIVGKYSCEIRVSGTIENESKCFTSEEFDYVVKPNITAKLDKKIKNDKNLPVLEKLIKDVKEITDGINKNEIQMKRDENLVGDNKTVVGAINQLREDVNSGIGGGTVELKDYQKKNDEFLNTDEKTITGGINEVNNKIKKVQESQIELDKDDVSFNGIDDISHDELNTTNKTLIGAINEVNTQCKDIENQIVNIGSPTQEQIDSAVTSYLTENPVTGGITTTAKNLLITILRNAMYTTNQSANITALENALASSEGGGNTPSVTTYTITNNLTNCANSNVNTSVSENSSYVANITANEGYTLDSVVITMGGEDITSTVYSEGSINISSVTGDIVITANASESSSIAELPQDGLDIFFDFRNATITSPYNLTGWGNVAKVETVGNNDYFIFSNTGTYTTNDYGLANFNTRGLRKKISETTNYIRNGTSHTIIGMTYGTCIPSLYAMTKATNIDNTISFTPYYKNTSGEGNQLSTQSITTPNPKNNAEYVIFALVMSDTELKLYSNGQLIATANSSDCTDFASWGISEGGFGCSFSGPGNYITACAYYNRPLSDVEIVEATEYFKTLEVTE